MNKQKFIEFLHKPGNLSAHDLSELDDLIDTYPYFQTAHALLAKGSRINKTPEAGKRTAAAAYVASHLPVPVLSTAVRQYKYSTSI